MGQTPPAFIVTVKHKTWSGRGSSQARAARSVCDLRRHHGKSRDGEFLQLCSLLVREDLGLTRASQEVLWAGDEPIEAE